MDSPAAPSHPLARRPHPELLIAWALLLIADGPVYGYRLCQELEARGVALDPSAMYRRLRNLERDELIISAWQDPVAGPRRRVYSRTAKGQRALHDATTLIVTTRETYSTFLQAHERALIHRASAAHEDASPHAPRDDQASQHSDSSGTQASTERLRPHKELLVAWLLLRLDAGPTYGYELRRALETHQLTTDAGTMYRMLGRLEGATWVQSRWLSSTIGPKRRFYRLTANGRRNLDEIAELIAAIRDSHDTYLRAYEHQHAPSAPHRHQPSVEVGVPSRNAPPTDM